MCNINFVTDFCKMLPISGIQYVYRMYIVCISYVCRIYVVYMYIVCMSCVCRIYVYRMYVVCIVIFKNKFTLYIISS